MTVVSTLAVTSIALFAGLAVANAADKEPRFAPGPATSYAARQTNNNVTVAAIPYITEDQVRSAFGKLDPNKYGILPLLVVIQNDGKQAIRLDGIKIEYITPGGTHIDATPANKTAALAQINAALRSGYGTASSHWNGTGLSSSSARAGTLPLASREYARLLEETAVRTFLRSLGSLVSCWTCVPSASIV